MKVCFKCGKEKHIESFYAHPDMKDGHLGKCKDCCKIDVSRNYHSKRGQYKAYEAERFKRPERKAKALEYARKRATLRPERYRASYAVTNAVRDGRLSKSPCEKCGAIKVEAHHYDYSKPLDVVWLCRKHHLEAHGKEMIV